SWLGEPLVSNHSSGEGVVAKAAFLRTPLLPCRASPRKGEIDVPRHSPITSMPQGTHLSQRLAIELAAFLHELDIGLGLG
ncbi:hypothetical protein, partial [Mesorhizobium sp.]|uniref:hypothetical protein n=1 Tax=Mesorhizobium sp. TaxID=1871066 RepID=UPI0025C03F14